MYAYKFYTKILVCRYYLDRNMPRSNVKYQLAGDDEETNDYFLQHVPDHQAAVRKAIFWNKMMQSFLLIAVYFVLSIGLTFYQKWLYGTYVGSKLFQLSSNSVT